MRRNTALGGKRDLDAQLNLTPFIDLLSTCVCFLLVTAVWMQIGTVEIKQSLGTEAAADKKETYDLDLVFTNATELRLNLKKDGKQVKFVDVKAANSEEMLLKLNEAIVSQVLVSKDLNVPQITIATATITPRSTVNYGEMVSALDVLRKNKIVNIGVLTAKEK